MCCHTVACQEVNHLCDEPVPTGQATLTSVTLQPSRLPGQLLQYCRACVQINFLSQQWLPSTRVKDAGELKMPKQSFQVLPSSYKLQVLVLLGRRIMYIVFDTVCGFRHPLGCIGAWPSWLGDALLHTTDVGSIYTDRVQPNALNLSEPQMGATYLNFNFLVVALKVKCNKSF